jgi:hypothetical protein
MPKCPYPGNQPTAGKNLRTAYYQGFLMPILCGSEKSATEDHGRYAQEPALFSRFNTQKPGMGNPFPSFSQR